MRWPLSVAAALAVLLAWSVAVRAQDNGETHHAYLPFLKRDATPTPTNTPLPTPTPTPGPWCDVKILTDFEDGLGGWMPSQAGEVERKTSDRPLDGAGPWVVELRPGEDEAALLRSPVFTAPDYPNMRHEVNMYYQWRSITGRKRPDDDFIAGAFTRFPYRGIDEDDIIADSHISETNARLWHAGGGRTGPYGWWNGWPEIQVAILAGSTGRTDTRWQIDAVRVEVCYTPLF